MTTVTTREDAWVSIAQAAEQLGVHARTLRRYIHDGKISVLRLSPQVVRIDPDELLRFRDAHLKVTTGTGVCYVPAPVATTEASAPSSRPTGAARFSH